MSQASKAVALSGLGTETGLPQRVWVLLDIMGGATRVLTRRRARFNNAGCELPAGIVTTGHPED